MAPRPDAPLHILAAGAVQGLVAALGPDLRTAVSGELATSFGAVGAMRERLLSGADVDVVVLSREVIADLEREGHILPGSAQDIGAVATGIAVREGEAAPDVSTPAALRAAVEAAGAIFMPDPGKATAGIHFARVLRELGLTLAPPRLRAYANGQAAMVAMAVTCDVSHPLGCTQATEIVATPGVTFAGPLPRGFELSTVYTAAVAARSRSTDAARRIVDRLTAPPGTDLRTRMGFSAGS